MNKKIISISDRLEQYKNLTVNSMIHIDTPVVLSYIARKMNVGLGIIDANFDMLFSNKRIQNVLGVSETDMLKTNMMDHIDTAKTNLDEVVRILELQKKGVFEQYEVWFKRPGQESIPTIIEPGQLGEGTVSKSALAKLISSNIDGEELFINPLDETLICKYPPEVALSIVADIVTNREDQNLLLSIFKEAQEKPYTFGVIIDITKRKEEEKEKEALMGKLKQKNSVLMQNAALDPTTGFLKRNPFEIFLDTAYDIARKAENIDLRVVFVKIRNFVQIQEEFGANAAKRAIQGIGEALEIHSGTKCRWENDTFVLFDVEVSRTESINKATDLAFGLKRHQVLWKRAPLDIQFDIGVSFKHRKFDNSSIVDMVNAAKKAMEINVEERGPFSSLVVE